ncbi:uncharacterized protein LOC116298256 [Actinia tenebrosa]|uniref:Uncharacterized protein LOC116298256 n=1 Tax=Actinia tenebrosa TaxID=6105 RepID=A0A6P8I1U0_ACTTE|nr:uncharacterized protein LOC116298256 [Actinia tenebrosa]
MEPSGIPTKEQEKSMKAMRTCQRIGGWYGLWSTVLAGAVSFAGLTMFCRERVPKKFIPMITLGCASGTGWMVSIWVTRSCRLEQLKMNHGYNSTNDDSISKEKKPLIHQYHSSDESTQKSSSVNKFGDEGFFQEKK